MSHSPDTRPCPGPVLVSACLAGQRCRYDGTASPDPRVMDLVARGRAIPFCPEIAGGLPTPRPACELRHGRVVDRDGADRTDAFLRGAEQGLDLARLARCDRAVLKARSPSCGLGHVYDGSFSGILVPGHGLFAAMLLDAGVHVATEEDREAG
ncbi:DUF523 domain-containing protein [Pseudodesulfovibrio pelocollis]|uniref:DUF523 domain-containing protein n=1 Tax=Pseudodesulfovibrio pelocollis TaxID=3051432 RepID=UPI00255B21EE|nr:DUF523 domain-containing protein [Pseudodesulfovibrio sp. SB368]